MEHMEHLSFRFLPLWFTFIKSVYKEVFLSWETGLLVTYEGTCFMTFECPETTGLPTLVQKIELLCRISIDGFNKDHY